MGQEYEVEELRNGGSADGALLLELLSRRPRRWNELESAGLSVKRVLMACSDLAEAVGHTVQIGPVFVELVEQKW
jgi:hypothetical protein